MFSSLSSRLAAVAAYATFASAVTLPIVRRDEPASSSSAMRIVMGNNTIVDPSDPFNFANVGGQIYTTIVRINGQDFQVDMDTGSSDLWIDTEGANMTGTIDTGILGAVRYEDQTSAIGNLTLANVTWGNYTVNNQVFISAPGTNATLGIRQGLLGLGPQTLSNISATVKFFKADFNGAPLLENIFDQYPDEPNFITFLLTRNVAGIIDGGSFTIGDIVPGYEAITSAPKLEVVAESNRWLTFIDGLVVNGKQVTAKSNGFPQITVPDDKLTAIFDTGISLDIAPRHFVDAMFKDIPGAEFDEDNSIYVVPCDTAVNVSLTIGGRDYPIHPVDLITPVGTNETDVICGGAFIAASEHTSIGDFQFGDVVLRNLYTLFDFGNWSRANDSGPFIQLLNLTNADQAFSEFESMQAARIQQFIDYYSQDDDSDSNSTSAASTASSTPSGSVISNIQTTEIPISAATATTAISSASAAGTGTTPTTAATNSPDASTTPAGTVSSATREATSNAKDLAVGALGDNDTTANSADYNNLIRNSYIIIGLLALVILLLIGVVVASFMRKMAPSGKNHKYKAIIPPVEEREVYSGPSGRYND